MKAIITIYTANGHEYTFSHYGTWMPGVYESELACVFASQVEDGVLHALWEEVLKREEFERVITLVDIDTVAPDLRIGSLFG